ncbi:MAG: methyltransferase domain-containing protein [Solirubrobacteraceae bacterium]|nr:methyltransferase domain-containing protein [Patulibacter sp.]
MTSQQTAVGTADTVDDKPANYFDWERPELVRHVQPTAKMVLDVGCGRGALGAAVKVAVPGAKVHGLEYVQEAVDVAATRLDGAMRVDLNTLTELPFEHGTFDTMIFGDVLEHLLDPEAALTMLLPYLAPEGRVIASIPNVKHWSVVLPLLINDTWTYEDAGLLDRTHVHFFTLTEATHMFQRVGLTQIHSCETNTIRSQQEGVLEPLLAAAQAYGLDKRGTEDLLNSYQYYFVVSR